MKKLGVIFFTFIFVVSCGGGGGGGGGGSTPPPNPAPSVNLSASSSEQLVNSNVTLTWSSSNATSCSASGDWSGTKDTSGSADVTISKAGSNTYSLACSGAGGTRSDVVSVIGFRNTDGIVVDGYISGADVFIDENDNFINDGSEYSTTSDNEGKFTIRYANGNLVSIGGTDLDSQTLLDNLLITHKLTGHSEFKAVTPVTSIEAFMEVGANINNALGIDSAIDISVTDPVANKGDGGIYDFLYEKGNQLTVLAYALQNITNDLNVTSETTEDYFKAIAEEIETEFNETSVKVDIETETFVNKAFENVIAAKSVTIDETAKANTIKALSGFLPIVEVKASDNLTTSVIRFAVSTLQEDIKAVANGTASAEKVASYTSDVINYIAQDQNISSNDITPDISAIDDSITTAEDTPVNVQVLANDSYITTAPISISATNGDNGTVEVAESSPEQITYSPDTDYFGSDTFSYTITQGDKVSSADVSVNISPVNDEPSLDIASTIQVPEGEILVTTISVSDPDEDELTLTLGGTDAESFNLSDEYVLSFKEAPNYETKSSYSITLMLTDGTVSINKMVTINIFTLFKGITIDGYIEGAEIFIDQNFNFRKDTGELSSVTAEDGSFSIPMNNSDLFNCLKSRPIVAEVPIGAIDSTLGEVTEEFQMILPSINDTGHLNIVISPFTSLLGDAIIKAKNLSSIKDELSLEQGCGDIGDEISLTISNELNQIKNSLSSSLNVSYEDLFIDFIADASNTKINELTAQNIAKFFPYFKVLTDEFDEELSSLHSKIINTNLTIESESINAIVSDPEISEIPLNFSAIYKTEPNEKGWFIEEKIKANGAKINNKTGELSHYVCFSNNEDCITDNLSLASLRDASKRYTRTSSFINNEYNSLSYNYQLVVEDEQRVDFDFDGNPSSRVCILQNWLYLVPVNQRENFTTNDRYNTGASSGSDESDDCVTELANKGDALFVALVDSYDDGVYFEEIDIRITNPNFSNSTFFANKVNDVYNNRDNLDIDPLIREIALVPRTFRAINIIRDKISESSSDQVSIIWTKRNTASQIVESSTITIDSNPENDNFTYATYINSETGSIRSELINSSGQQARDDLFSIISSKSPVFNTEEFIGNSPVTDNRTPIKGTTIDGYISGANVFFDVNFNQRLDAGEYSAPTDENGEFEIIVDNNDLSCVRNRPIVANIPVGAVDSSQGIVTEAYQMLLPSVNDAGSNKIVISPFTSLLTEAILKGKAASEIDEDLTVFQGCSSEGNAVAENISTEVNALLNEIENTFNVTWEDLISDFIATGGTNNITEDIAVKVAAFFPYYKEIKDEISSELSTRYNKDVTPNVSLSKDSLEAILSDGEFTELPLEFFSVYQTSPNAQGFYNVDEISSTGATVTANGELKRYLCTLSNSADCDISGLTLNGVGNASKNYIRQVNINNDSFTVDGVVGNINIRGRDSRGVRNEDSNPESYCESEETIQFVGPQDSKGLQMEYRYGFGRGVNNLKDCSFLPNYGPSISLRIEKQGRGENFPDTAPTWAIQFGVNNLGTSRLTESKVFNIIDNDDLDPEALIKEVALIPAAFSELADMRKLLSYGEGVYYYYSPNTSVDYDSGETFKSYWLQASSAPRDDQFYINECTPDDGCNDVGERLFGQAARDAMFNIMSGSKYDYDGFIGESAPVSNILFEYESSGVQFNDNLVDGKQRSYRVYPRLSTSTGWIDASLVGSEISKASIDAFINGDYTINTTFNLGLNVDAPFTSVEEFNLKIFSNDQYSTSSEYLELTVELKIETLASGAVQITWLDQGKVTFKFVDDDISIIKNVINTDGDKTRSIPKGNYTFEDFDFLKSLLDKVRNQFGSSELQLIKDFFKNGSDYSFKIDLGSYAILDDYDQISSMIAGTFGIADTPVNSIYSYKNNIIFGEGTVEDICFDTAWAAEEDITFDIKPVYRDKPGYMTAEEVSFSSTSVTIEKGTSQKCVTFSSPVDDKLQERQEFIEFEIDNVVNAKSGRNIPIRLTVQDD